MNKTEQKQLIKDMANEIKNDLIFKADILPENWDGNEIRQWISDFISLNYNYQPLKGKRLRDYKNDLQKNITLL